ncbi:MULTISPECIES: alpha/beta hydrolase [Rhodococcus]|uniref:Alpha/beta hydrolase n=1 Tax=Rhodococcus oxybenzonivorans TaxID=1990687 RepID=A0AAE5A4K6_9NOCA|nr:MULTISPECIES: alpha/beta hydrolase [Rhodococcus]MDV7243385.1 alpha/beta hydrolase [Rhodococcus oxybenzonivorans]MDV7263915.1 alpha/beta hydrolase [Rhodococcus oxybenzonivorans]MDV7276811.1 alpha/beta hydrolase [Rhodococcus oxybenzonivorans]MDV7334355.1 alpha/beta hydrolase [Rhodococcus oxybenzonivorans]MDV7344510.1 alpha/beta hydrolase [Rhodococcus oxybenzonivorans]
MTLDARTQQWLDGIASSGMPSLNELPVPAAREAFAGAVATFGLAATDQARIEDRACTTAHGQIPVRIYTPAGSGPFPVLVYFHGGGWVLGDLDSADGICSLLAVRSHAVVVSVGYTLAPEAQAPTPAHEGYAVAQWVVDNAALINADPERIAVGGDSAGGNIAAVVALMARDAGAPRFVHQLLLYPVVTQRTDADSYTRYGTGYFVTADMMQWFFDLYVGNEDRADDWQVSPLVAPSLAGLPEAHVIVAEYDPTRDDAEEYAAKLAASGTTVTLKRYTGQIHGFVSLAAAMPQGETALTEAAARLRSVFRRGWEPRVWLGR